MEGGQSWAAPCAQSDWRCPRALLQVRPVEYRSTTDRSGKPPGRPAVFQRSHRRSALAGEPKTVWRERRCGTPPETQPSEVDACEPYTERISRSPVAFVGESRTN